MITIVRLLNDAKLEDACQVGRIRKKSVGFIVHGNSPLTAPPSARDYRVVTFDGTTATLEFYRKARRLGGVKLECKPRSPE